MTKGNKKNKGDKGDAGGTIKQTNKRKKNRNHLDGLIFRDPWAID